MFYLWIRKQVRKFMKPIGQKKAEDWSRGLTVIYALSAWGCCSLMFYQYKTTQIKLREADAMVAAQERLPGLYYGRVMQAQNMHMYTFEGGKLEKAGVYSIDKDEEFKKRDKDFYGEEIPQEKQDDFE